MPAFQEIFIDKKLLDVELNELLNKGYLKLKIELSLPHLTEFQSQYRIGDEMTFHASDNIDVKTRITTIDIAEPHGAYYKLFIGFTLV